MKMNTGLIHIYYGDGKGKTTAAVGQAVRSAGYGYKVLFYQFLKNNTSSERNALAQMDNITCMNGREEVKFSFQMSEEEKEEVRNYNKEQLQILKREAENYDILILDEAVCVTGIGLLEEKELIDFLKNKPKKLEVILTGHTVSVDLLDIADYVTEMKKVKHPFDRGIVAREGIEL